MARGDRNQSRYAKPAVKQTLEAPEACTPAFLEFLWKAAVARDPIKTPYDAFNDASLSGEATAEALAMLYEKTGDEAFRTALLALRAYELDKGGLKENLRRAMRGAADARPAVWLLMPHMASWRSRVAHDSQAARLTAAQHGVRGQSFDAVVNELRKAYALWNASVRDNKPTTGFPSGDTGRKLKVRMARPWLGTDNLPLKEIRGVTFDADGSALAPDDFWWRRMIHDGHFCLVASSRLVKV
ncbi:MAG TPA: hypothetical protein VKG91_09810 [Roseiarcus sp.]|nr:hypothetical protein [Roseiarcus sp.]